MPPLVSVGLFANETEWRLAGATFLLSPLGSREFFVGSFGPAQRTQK
jgi:hypothetical protein